MPARWDSAHTGSSAPHLEQRSLTAQRLRVDGLLTEEALHFTRAGRAVAGEVIVEEAENISRIRGSFQRHGPRAHLLRTIELHARVVGDLAVRPHPSHIEKV